MKIQIAQPEIEAAIAQYISGQGLTTGGKKLSIQFTALRKGRGIMADLSLEDPNVPAEAAATVTHADEEDEQPVKETPATEQPVTEAQAPVAAEKEPEVAEPATEAAPANTVNLFG